MGCNPKHSNLGLRTFTPKSLCLGKKHIEYETQKAHAENAHQLIKQKSILRVACMPVSPLEHIQ